MSLLAITTHRLVALIIVAIVAYCLILTVPNRSVLLSRFWNESSGADTTIVICVNGSSDFPRVQSRSSTRVRSRGSNSKQVNDGGSNSMHHEQIGLLLPDSNHRVVTVSTLRLLEVFERAVGGDYLARPKSRGIISNANRTIVLRYRTNTSTVLEPAPDAGRVSAIFMGRTGNRMLIYAGLYGVARRNGMRHVISAKNPLLTLFKLNVTVVPEDRPGRDWPQFVLGTGYNKGTEYLDRRTDVELYSFLGDWNYRALVMQDLLQNHFRFRDDILLEADTYLRRSMEKYNFTPSDVAVIAVHIRRTDLLRRRVESGRMDSVADEAYFRHATAFFNRLFRNRTMYVVCSDDIEWAKENFVAKRPTVFSVGHSADVDFAILSRCNHSIITMGTFGRWSALLAGGVTIYQRPNAATSVPLDAANRTVNSTQDPVKAWIALS